MLGASAFKSYNSPGTRPEVNEMDALVRCPRCWKRVPQTARFCRRCGCALPPAILPTPPARNCGGPNSAALLQFLLMGAAALAGLALFTTVTHHPPRYGPPPLIQTSPPPVPDPWFDSWDDRRSSKHHTWPDRQRTRRYPSDGLPTDVDPPPMPEEPLPSQGDPQ